MSKTNIFGSLSSLLAPRSIAILGASTDHKKVGGRVVDFLKSYGYQGDIYPVNERYPEVQGLKSYPSVKDILEPVDLALISLPTVSVIDAVKDCAASGVKSCVIFTSGFAEMGDAGKLLQQQIGAIAKQAGMRVLGPNCQGIVNTELKSVVSFATSFASGEMIEGSSAILSQSGAVAQMVYNHYQRLGKGVRYWAATGNEADVQVAELIKTVAKDAKIKVIQIYLESITDGPALIEAAQCARELNKPVLAIKSGRSDVGQKAAASHTGAIAAEDAVVDAAFRRAGITRVESVEEMIAFAHMFETDKPMRGNRIGVLSNSGALGVMMVDAAQQAELTVVEFSDKTQQRLAEVLPAFASPRNPIDVTAQFLHDRSLIPNALRILADDEEIDAICVGLGIIGKGYDIDAIVQDIVDANRYSNKIITMAWVGAKEDATPLFFTGGVPAFEDYSLCMKALGAYANYNGTRIKVADLNCLTDTTDGYSLLDYQVPGSNCINEYRSKILLKSWGLPVTKEILAKTPADAAASAKQIGYPIVAKVVSDKIPHKTEIGGVQLNIQNDEQVLCAFRDIHESACKVVSEEEIEGILIQKMCSGVFEMSLGCKNDPIFGPVIMIAAGGIYIEVLKDFTLLMPPVSRQEAVQAIEGLMVAPLLKGARGKPKADISALADLIVTFSNFVERNKNTINEIDLNPVIVKEEGDGVEIVDALIKTK